MKRETETNKINESITESIESIYYQWKEKKEKNLLLPVVHQTIESSSPSISLLCFPVLSCQIESPVLGTRTWYRLRLLCVQDT